ncbi:hypothetical protein QTO28_18225 [Streptomyces sp. P9-2B-1]|uniref:hypothetical protein n=1 Tax=Streptomyces sp. P9-2B-1 TaxID=3057115 RepID=UPI0025B3CAFD|nr:hypothetical protein [Streptomyces sp. P9-2B-1]WJY32811.1 hypothetical protein QTO28_18225 [Streptomyces sp. P9-2B-1]
MTAPNDLRLLPWLGPEGKPCYLSTDDPVGYISRLADNIEAIQLATAAQLLEDASGSLENEEAGMDTLRRLGHDLRAALSDVLRVAVSRGHLLAAQRFETGRG